MKSTAVVKDYRLTEEEVSALQRRIVSEGWMHTYEAMSMHILEHRYTIDGVNYVFYYAIGYDMPDVWKYV